MKWKELDPKYHFSCQFTADTISMNATDFVIASTYQEIAGRLVPFISKQDKQNKLTSFTF